MKYLIVIIFSSLLYSCISYEPYTEVRRAPRIEYVNRPHYIQNHYHKEHIRKQPKHYHNNRYKPRQNNHRIR